MLYHAFPAWLPGGFTGVDVFFVISGYLITQLMLREAERHGTVDLAAFWARRIRRILPAATVVLCATALLAALLTSSDMRLLGRHIIAAALFYYNWRQAAEAVDYLRQADNENPLMHYWTLSVEEQFYLVWPLLFAGVAYLTRGTGQTKRALTWLTLLLVGLSFTYSLYLTQANAPLAFFSTFTRAWQLLAGAGVALASLRLASHRRLMGLAGALAGVALLAGFWSIGSAVPYPGFAALVPTLATAALLYSGATAPTLVSRVLSVAPARFAGRISYSWYLWHWPLIVLLPAIFKGRADVAAPTAWAIGLSFVLAVVTYRYVEQPLRHSDWLHASGKATYGLGASLVLLGLATGLWMKHAGPDSVHLGDGKWISRAAVRKDIPVIYQDGCLLKFRDVAQPPCVYGTPTAERTVVLLGDSHAGNWFTPLNAAAEKVGWRLLARVKASCHPHDGEVLHNSGLRYTECDVWSRNVLDEMDRLRPDLIIIASARALPREGETPILHRLAAASGRLVIMRDTPRTGEDPLNCLAGARHPSACSWPMKDAMPDDPYPLTPQSGLPRNAVVLDLNRRICPDSMCRVITDGMVTMSDNNHLTASYAATLAGEFEAVLSAAAAHTGQRPGD